MSHRMESCLSRPRSSSSVLYLLQFLVFGSQKFFALASWASAFISPKFLTKNRHYQLLQIIISCAIPRNVGMLAYPAISHPSIRNQVLLPSFWRRRIPWDRSFGILWMQIRNSVGPKTVGFFLVSIPPKNYWRKNNQKIPGWPGFFRGRTLLVSGSVGVFLRVMM